MEKAGEREDTALYQSMNLPLCERTGKEYGNWDGVRQECARLGLDGVEGIWGGEDIPKSFPPELLVGYHLTFFPDWLDFYRKDAGALERKFIHVEAIERYYGGSSPEVLLRTYREDLERSVSLGAKYVVFHVTDVSLEENYTYHWLHTNEEIIDTAVELINLLLDVRDWPFEFLVENQWWPGFTFTEPENTARLLEGIHYLRKGIVLDTGHLMNVNPAIRSQGEGLRFIHRMLDRHGTLCRSIRAVHLHQSISGTYVRAHTGELPDLPEDYGQRFAVSYAHVQQIDQHRPWTDPAVGELVARLAPAYLTHELSARTRRQREAAIRTQRETLQKGGRCV